MPKAAIGFAALLLAPLASAASIKLSWQDNSDNEIGFIVERRLDSEGSTWMVVETILSDDPEYIGKTEWTDVGVGRGVKYVYRVQAYNEFGSSNYTNEAKGTANGGPKAPSAATAEEVPDPPTNTPTSGASNR